MSECLGLDVGTTTVKAVVIESETGAVVRRATAPNDSEMTSSEDKRAGRSEWDPDRILAVAQQVLSEVGSDTVRAVGVTGQMHGMLLVDGCGRPIGPFIGWQDQRGAEPKPDSNRTLVADLIERLDTSDPARHVCRPKTGYMGATLSWLLAYDQVPAGSRACSAPSLTDTKSPPSWPAVSTSLLSWPRSGSVSTPVAIAPLSVSPRPPRFPPEPLHFIRKSVEFSGKVVHKAVPAFSRAKMASSQL